MQQHRQRHPDIQKLLAWLDADASGYLSGEVSGRAHLDGCADCRAELERLRATRAALRDLSALRPVRDGWPELCKRMGLAPPSAPAETDRRVSDSRPFGSHTREWLRPLAAMAASVLVVVGLVLGLNQDDALTTVPTISRYAPISESLVAGRVADGGQLASLVDDARYLERSLIAQQRTSRVMSLGQAGTVSALRDQLALVDSILNARGAELDSASRERLWRQRVQLMRSLISAQSRPAQWSEF